MTSLLLAVKDTPSSAGLYQALSEAGPWQVHGPARSLADAKEVMQHYQPQLLVADLWLPDGPISDLLQQLNLGSGLPTPLSGTHVLVLTSSETHPLLMEALQAGADSYFVTTQGSTQDLAALVTETLAGGARIAPWIARRLLDHFDTQDGLAAQAHVEDLVNPLGLTTPERNLLKHLALGESLQELAQAEGVRPRDLTARVRLIYRKMQWSQRAGNLALS